MTFKHKMMWALNKIMHAKKNGTLFWTRRHTWSIVSVIVIRIWVICCLLPSTILCSTNFILLSLTGYGPFLCLLEILPLPNPQTVSTLPSLCSSHFPLHYHLYYGIFHLPRKTKCVINHFNKTMRQIGLVMEHITKRTKVSIIIFSNIDCLTH